MAIKAGDVVDIEATITAEDGSSIAVAGAVTVTAATGNPTPPEPEIPPNPGPEPEPDVSEKIYKPEEFAGDVTAMGKKIIADQTAAGDGKMRAVVQWTRGKTYEYTDNQFMTGVQRYRCEATGQGERPKLRNVTTNAPVWILEGPLCLGKGANCFVEPNAAMSKTKAMALIADAEVGDESVTLLTASDAGRLKAGRWHGVFSYCQQCDGYPPNVRWIDYVQVVGIEGTKVTLDRALAHAHFADYWENPGDEYSVGKARIGLWDEFHNGVRCTLEGTWKGVEFIGEHQAGRDVTYVESHIEALFEDCKISNLWVSMNKRVVVKNCILTGAGDQAAEPDKLGEELVFDGVTQANLGQYVQAATGWERFIIKNSKLNCMSVSPRKLTVTDTVIDTHGDTKFYVPINWAFNGPVLEASFTGVTFAANTPAQATWTYSSNPVSPLPLSASSWQGNKLVIPRSFAGFEPWLVWVYEGTMVFTGATVDKPGNYGKVVKIHAPADGSALWLDVDWLVGTKPTSGNLNVPQHGLRKLVWGAGTKIAPGNWIDPSFMCIEGTPADRPFPEGIS